MKYISLLFLHFAFSITVYGQYTMEDTIKYQMGHKLHFTKPIPTGTPITAIYKGSWKYYEEDNVEYAFIVHDKYSPYHGLLSIDSINAMIERDKKYMHPEYAQFLHDQIKSPINADIDKKCLNQLKGYWYALIEYKGNYYVEDSWDIPSLMQLTDSTYSWYSHEGFTPQRISKFRKDKKGTIQASYIAHNTEKGSESFTMELIDKKRSLYKFNNSIYITPVSAIHNYEIIVYCNNTGDIIIRPDFNKKYQGN